MLDLIPVRWTLLVIPVSVWCDSVKTDIWMVCVHALSALIIANNKIVIRMTLKNAIQSYGKKSQHPLLNFLIVGIRSYIIKNNITMRNSQITSTTLREILIIMSSIQSKSVIAKQSNTYCRQRWEVAEKFFSFSLFFCTYDSIYWRVIRVHLCALLSHSQHSCCIASAAGFMFRSVCLIKSGWYLHASTLCHLFSDIWRNNLTKPLVRKQSGTLTSRHSKYKTPEPNLCSIFEPSSIEF